MFRLCQPRLMFAFTLLIYASECILLAHHLSLKEFNADASLACDPLVGPTFIRYLLEPGHRVPAKRIVGQGANLQVRLQLDEEPMIGLVVDGSPSTYNEETESLFRLANCAIA